MSLRRLTAFVVLVELIGLGILFAFILGAVATLDMTQFGERWLEYWLMLALIATAPYALYAGRPRNILGAIQGLRLRLSRRG